MLGLGEYLTSPCACANRKVVVAALVYANGVKHYKLRCNDCGHWLGGPVAREKLDNATMKSAPMVQANAANHSCARCGSPATELHHWAPRSLFDDFDVWPTAWLCRACHARWHSIIEASRP